jgi:hypothetical protein
MKRLLAVVALAAVTLVSVHASAILINPCVPGDDSIVPGFITNPTSGTVVDSTQSITIQGYATAPGPANSYARNWANVPFSEDLIDTIDVPAANEVSTNLYFWSYDLVLTPADYPEYWVPKINPPAIYGYQPVDPPYPGASVGRLELSIDIPNTTPCPLLTGEFSTFGYPFTG